MSALGEKREHVRKAKQTRDHECHWPDCKEQVKPAFWGCRRHWFMLPKRLRDRIWATYKPGQEITMTPSVAYLKAAQLVQDWIDVQNTERP